MTFNRCWCFKCSNRDWKFSELQKTSLG